MSESRLEVLQADYATLLERWKEEQTKRIEAEQQRDMTGRLSEGLEADLTDRICEVNDLKAENRRLLDRLSSCHDAFRNIMKHCETVSPNEYRWLTAWSISQRALEESAVEGRVPRSQDEANEIAYETGQTDGIQCPKRTILHGGTVECVLYEGHAGECYWQAAADEGQCRHNGTCFPSGNYIICGDCDTKLYVIDPSTAEAEQCPECGGDHPGEECIHVYLKRTASDAERRGHCMTRGCVRQEVHHAEQCISADGRYLNFKKPLL